MTTGNLEREEIEALLPWYAAGRLKPRDADRVAAALKRDPKLAGRYALVREELAATIHLNETLGAPSSAAMNRLFAAIDADADGRRRHASLGRWVAALLSQISPRALAWAAAVAVFVIALEAGLLAGLYVRGPGFETASSIDSLPAGQGAFALVRFNPAASAADINAFLDAYKAAIVDGPRAGGIYRVRVAPTALPREELAGIVTRMAKEKTVGFAAPAQ